MTSEVERQIIERKAKLLEVGKDPLRFYAYKRWVEEGEDAADLFES